MSRKWLSPEDQQRQRDEDNKLDRERRAAYEVARLAGPITRGELLDCLEQIRDEAGTQQIVGFCEALLEKLR